MSESAAKFEPNREEEEIFMLNSNWLEIQILLLLLVPASKIKSLLDKCETSRDSDYMW